MMPPDDFSQTPDDFEPGDPASHESFEDARFHDAVAAATTRRYRPTQSTDAFLASVHARIDHLSVPSEPPVPTRQVAHQATRNARTRPFVRPSTLAAAVAAVVVILGYVMWPASRPTASTMRPIATHTYTTAAAQRASVQLPDGSAAQLAPNTTLRYGQDAAGNRVVTLDGQAQFTVAHDPAHTFIVQTGTVHVRVLGTTFDVRRYSNDATARVAVLDGRVAAGNGSVAPPLVLQAGMLGTLTDSTAVMSHADVRALTAWTRDTLSFTNTTVPAMLASVGRWLGYDFRVADSALRAQHVTVALSVGNPRETMRVLKDLLDVTMVFDDSVVTLHPRKASRGNTPVPSTRDSAFPAPTSEFGK